MPRLTRQNMKVFASEATNNGVFGSLQAGNPTITNNVETLQSLTAWEEGWDSATLSSAKLPPLEEIQGVEYVTTYQQAYLMQEGMPEWSANVTYYKGSLTKKVTTDGFQIYCSLTDNNTGNLLNDTVNWKLVMDSDDLYAFDSSVVHIAGAETITGEKTFSPTTNKMYINGESVLKSNTGSQIRLVDGGDKYGVILRQDGLDTWILLTDENDPTGSWNSLRPLHINNQTGIVYAENNSGINSTNSVVTTTGSASGAIRLNNGLFVQTGSGYATNSGWRINFSTPFNNANYRLIPVFLEYHADWDQTGVAVGGKDIYGCTVYNYDTVAIDWIAIGI